MDESILDEISRNCNIYISDLKNIYSYPQAIQYLKSFSFESHSIHECNYALAYIFQTDCRFENYGQLREFLKTVL
ncbi:MAG: hypothetical protein N2171_00130 [Clostridia bacterium]|nr:hypothetical protein [Clostridia bacterium]